MPSPPETPTKINYLSQNELFTKKKLTPRLSFVIFLLCRRDVLYSAVFLRAFFLHTSPLFYRLFCVISDRKTMTLAELGAQRRPTVHPNALLEVSENSDVLNAAAHKSRTFTAANEVAYTFTSSPRALYPNRKMVVGK